MRVNCFWVLIGSTIASLFTVFESTNAQIVRDTTLPVNSEITTTGNDAIIRGGTQVGGNLFHSFDRFSVPTNGSAFFDNALTVQNIISRVTGSLPSSIDGTIGANGTANLFLINPNGILFGENARLNIGGSFVASTANAIRLGDTELFSASDPASRPLLNVNPSALLFTTLQRPAEIVSRSVVPVGVAPMGRALFGLRVPDGQNLLLIGGDVQIDGGGVGGLNALGGRIELGGLAGSGQIGLNSQFQLTYPTDGLRSNVSLINNSRVSVRGTGAGDIVVNANDFTATNGGRLVAGTEGTGKAGSITVNAKTVNFSGAISDSDRAGLSNAVEANTTGNGGDININANVLTLSSGARINAITLGQGNVGNILLNVLDRVTVEGRETGIFNNVRSSAIANAGDLTIIAGSLVVADGAQLSASTFGRGNAGNVIINVRDRATFNNADAFSNIGEDGEGKGGDVRLSANSLELTNGSVLSTSTFGKGDAGNVQIKVTGNIALIGSDIFSTVEAGATGQGGNINLEAGSLFLSDSSQLNTFVRGASEAENLPPGQGNAGNARVDAQGAITITGKRGTFPTGIRSGTSPGVIGNGGNIVISATSLEVSSGAELSARTLGKGNAGNITIDVRDRVTFNNGFAFSTIAEGGEGNGGDVRLSANSLEVSNGANLNASTFGKGNAGNVIIDVRDRVSFNDGFARGRVEQDGEGKGGSVRLSANSLELTNGSALSASTFGKGDAGNVQIQVTGNVALIGSDIFSTVEAGASGQGGNINLEVGSLFLSDSSQLNTFVRGASRNLPPGQGNAGSVRVDVQGAITITGKRGTFPTGIRSEISPEVTGNGGNIVISTGSLEVSNGAELRTSVSGKGNAGNITIEVRDRAIFDNGFAQSRIERSGEGNSGDVKILANSLELLNGAELDSGVFSEGDAGNVLLGQADRPITSIVMSGVSPQGFSSGVFADTASDRPAGNIQIIADQMSLSKGAVINAQTSGSGDSGDISIRANTVELLSGSQILAITTGSGAARNITLDAKQLIISGSDPTYTQRRAQFGDIVDPISPESGIYTRSLAIGNAGGAGNIFLTVPQIQLRDRGRIDAQSATVNGGNITINASEFLVLRSNSLITATAGTAQAGGNGGNIFLNAPNGFVVALPNEDSDIRANAFAGRGGNIQIAAQTIYGIEFRAQPTNLSDITASSQIGISGNVTLNTPDVDPSRGTIKLSTTVLDRSNQISQACTPKTVAASSFTNSGRGSFPPSPLDALRDVTSSPELASLEANVNRENSRDRSELREANRISSLPTADPLIEAQGWIKDAQGNVSLVASTNTETIYPTTLGNCN